MDIFEKATELGRMIAQSDKMQRLHASENALENSDEAKELMEVRDDKNEWRKS